MAELAYLVWPRLRIACQFRPFEEFELPALACTSSLRSPPDAYLLAFRNPHAHFHMNVDAVQEEAADAFLVAGS